MSFWVDLVTITLTIYYDGLEDESQWAACIGHYAMGDAVAIGVLYLWEMGW